ncbi:hypothetical protein QUF72_17360 [Desulfobacterales bacterium HSG2]|nr:hypothetical protein [Desulfobacterales bacterium HSG2]
MKTSQSLKAVIIIGLCVLCVVSCGDSNGNDDDDDSATETCDCSSSATVEKSGLVLSLADQDEETPANVSVLFKVETDNDEPVIDLNVSNVRIFEDGESISEYESQLAILPKPGKFTSYTLLLLDLSGSVLESESLPELKKAAEGFVNAMMPDPGDDDFGEIEIGIWWFDGATNIHQLASFTTDSYRLITEIDTIDENISSDSSTNLYGAVIQGIDRVENLADEKENSISVGSLVIFTDGKDQAGRKTKEVALNAVDNADEDISVYSIGLGGEIDEPTLKLIGRDDFVFAEDIDELVTQFEKIANNIREDVKSYYLLEYCSPKRKGSHDLKISVMHEDPVTQDTLSGSMTTCFCAEGFKGGCEVSVDN